MYGQPEPGISGPLFDDDPFGESIAEPSHEEIHVARLIWKHRGRNNPVSIAKLRENTGYSERQIKDLVAQLVVNHRLKIGARREEPAGYFVIESCEDLAAAVGPYKAQIHAMLRRLRALETPEAVRQFVQKLAVEG